MITIPFSLVLLVLAAAPLETWPTPATRLYVRTVPPGARVILDGKPLGTSEGLFLVPPGVARITIELDGHQPEVRQIEIQAARITGALRCSCGNGPSLPKNHRPRPAAKDPNRHTNPSPRRFPRRGTLSAGS